MMNQSIINQRIRVALPPEFHQMDPEEKKRIYALSAVVPEWCARDSERHMIFSASWKQMNGLLAAMACSMDGAKGLEKRMRLALRDRDYRFGQYFRGELDGKKAFGFTYRYILNFLSFLTLIQLFDCQTGYMVFLYHKDVQERCVQLGLITEEKIKQNQRIFKILGISSYFIYIIICVYIINGARGFWPAFWQMFAILSIANVIDRLLIDEYWVGHTKAWEIPGTEDLKPYINRKDKIGKWLVGTVGFAILCAILAGIMTFVVS